MCLAACKKTEKGHTLHKKLMNNKWFDIGRMCYNHSDKSKERTLKV